ncbi:hypothetical protein CO038_01920 [Candidatus Pacearchaeota archaeon CG_4_9_14_0_2_um_filter_39_13]|nr:hypothetical protein [Candidatus Pacearchaeota archaeon]OIO43137.1 MAG: hypothetical protein AUJ64_03070 [Candidatus Pacearchaeota archaeon CG1_02_39_14]PJC44705.1 MAG: hypothetical protein CO038_01920 [Candidatus Pacearchaeota archaeon CG_4_9_14_0_2_um_filter_39_13]
MDLIHYVEQRLLIAMPEDISGLLNEWAKRREVLDRYDFFIVNGRFTGAELDLLRQDLIGARNAASNVRDGYHKEVILFEIYREAIDALDDKAMRSWSDKIPRRMMKRMEWNMRKIDKALSYIDWAEKRN